jgi:hypothetical protein
MRQHRILGTAAVLLGIAGCSDHPTSPDASSAPASIINGTPTGDSYPEVGALVLTADNTPFCSGVLISPTLFLSAGHCEYFWTSTLHHGDYGVTFDPVVTASSPVVLATGYLHPDWKIVEPFTETFTINNDVSVFVLDHPVRNIRPATLPEQNILDELNSEGKLAGMMFETVGYGNTDLLPDSPVGVGTRRVARQGFLELMADHDHLRLNERPGGSSYFDSGGPHYFAGTHVIASTTSGGSGGPGDEVIIDETTRTDTKSVLRFVRSFMKDCDHHERGGCRVRDH